MTRAEARHAFRLGQCFAGQGNSRLNIIWPLLIATACLGLALSCLSFCVATYSGIENRSEAFAPRFSTTESPVAFARQFTGPAPLTVFAIQPTTMQALPPPGLAEWPRPGGAWVSPEYAKKYPVGAISPFGRVEGIIDGRKLATLDEHWVYFNPSHLDLKTLAEKYPDITMSVAGFGNTDGSFSLLYSESRAVFMGILAIFVVLPALAFMWSAAGIGLTTRREALATFRALGSSRRFLGIALWGECGNSIMGGLGIALIVSALPQFGDLRFPLTRSYLLQTDARAVVVQIVLTVTAGAMAAFLCVIFRAAGADARRTVSTVKTDAFFAVWAWAAPASLIALVQQWPNAIADISARQLAYLGLIVVLLSSTPALVWVTMKHVARGVARSTSSAHSLIGARQLESLSGRFVTTCLALVACIGLLGGAQLFTTFYGDAVAQSRDVGERVGTSILITQFAFTETRPQIEEILKSAPVLDFVAIQSQPPAENSSQWSYSLYGSCESLKALAITCPDQKRILPTLSISNIGLRYFIGSDQLSVENVAPQQIASIAPSENTVFLIVNTKGENIDLATVQPVASQYLADVHTVSATWSNDLNAQHMMWLVLLMPITTILLCLALCFNSWSAMLERLAAISPFTLLWRDSKLLWSVSTSMLLAPLLTGLAAGLAVYGALGSVFAANYEGMHVDGLSVVLIAATGIATVSIFWAVATSILLNRISRSPLGALS